MSRAEIESMIICECGEKSVKEAIQIFRDTDLPYKKAKRLVTGCDKSCCRNPLRKLFDMVYFGKIEYEEIERLIELRHDKFASFLDSLSPST